jgi:hypothetical protein
VDVGVTVATTVGVTATDGVAEIGATLGAVTVGEGAIPWGVGDSVGAVAVTETIAVAVAVTVYVAIALGIAAGTAYDVGLADGSTLGAAVEGSAVSERDGDGVGVASCGVDVGNSTVATVVVARGAASGVVRGGAAGSDVPEIAVGIGAKSVVAVGATVEVAASGVVAGGVGATKAVGGRTARGVVALVDVSTTTG